MDWAYYSKCHVNNFINTIVPLVHEESTYFKTNFVLYDISCKILYCSYRQAILSPLHVCNALDKYDIVARVRGSGMSGQAGAIRLAVAKSLAQFVGPEQRDMLSIGKIVP